MNRHGWLNWLLGPDGREWAKVLLPFFFGWHLKQPRWMNRGGKEES